MKRTILVLLTLLPVAAMARQRGPDLRIQSLTNIPSANALPAGTDEAQPSVPYRAVPGLSTEPSDGSLLLEAAPEPQSQNPGGVPETATTGPSMVGYIDDALVGTQLIVRAEADIQNLTPDLAEFTFAKCSCDSSVVGTGGHGPDGIPANVNMEVLHLFGEYALNRRFSLLAEAPFRLVQPQAFVTGSFGHSAGLSDVIVGFKFALIASPTHYLTFQLESSFPSGNASLSLGTGHYTVQSSLLYYQRVTQRVTIESEIGNSYPIGGSPGPNGSGTYAGDVLNYGIGPSYKLFNGKNFQFAPIIEFIGWRVTGGYATNAPKCGTPTQANPVLICSAAGINMLNLKGGGRVTFKGHNSVYVGYGRALTGSYWTFRVMKIEYRYSF